MQGTIAEAAENASKLFEAWGHGQVLSSLIASVTIVFAAIIMLLVQRYGFKKIITNKTCLGILSLVFLIGIWCLKLLGSVNELGDIPFFDRIADTTLRTIMAFGGDENQKDYFDVVKLACEGCFGEHFAWLTTIYRAYAAILLVAAPLVGGALVLEVFSGVFPKLGVYLRFCRPHYYFSELNERSIILAESIFKNLKGKPLLIFTDAYLDDESEGSAELHERAKRIGARCISDDPVNFHPRTVKERSYFFMDMQESENLQALTRFSDIENIEALKRASVYVFYQDESYSLTETNVWANIEKNAKTAFADDCEKLAGKLMRKVEREAKKLLSCKKRDADYNSLLTLTKATLCGLKLDNKKAAEFTQEELDKLNADIREKLEKDAADAIYPYIRRVRYGQNLIFNLLNSTPLFTPLLQDDAGAEGEQRQFNLSILGFGELGTQMLLASTWCGQMLGYTLNINVAYDNDVNDLKRRLDRISPEILLSATENDDILRVYDDKTIDEHSPVYFNLRHATAVFPQCNLRDITFSAVKGGGDFKLVDSDYIFISLGTDKLNITVAEQVKRAVAAKQVNEHAAASMRGEKYTPKPVIIAMAVFDPHLNSLFNDDYASSLVNDGNEPGITNVKIIAYGSLSFSHSMENIMMQNMSYDIGYYAKSYNIIRKLLVPRKRAERSYDYWSNAAKVVHEKYKVFSAYRYSLNEDKADAWGKNPQALTLEEAFDVYNELIKDKKLKESLAWVEHRRWAAYLRSTGFVRRELATLDGTQRNKNVNLKMHVALVEAKQGDGRGKSVLDRLDIVEKAVGYDMKIYDNPQPLSNEEQKPRELTRREKRYMARWQDISNAKMPLSKALKLAGKTESSVSCGEVITALRELGGFLTVSEISTIRL